MPVEFHRVRWRDGDVITEQHFKLLEQWIAESINGVATLHATYGLVDVVPSAHSRFNMRDSIVCHQLDGIHWRVDIAHLQFVTPNGILARIVEKRSYDLTIRLSDLDQDEGVIYLFLLVDDSTTDEADTHDYPEVETDIARYPQQFSVATSDDKNGGLPIYRFRVTGDQIVADNTFIPFGMFVDSNEGSRTARDTFMEKLDDFRRNLQLYFKTLQPSTEQYMVWILTAQFIRICERYWTVLSHTHTLTHDYLLHMQQLFDCLRAEIHIFSVGTSDESLRQKAFHTVDNIAKDLRKSLMKGASIQVDLYYAFQTAAANVDAIREFTAELPEGIKKEKWLKVGAADIESEGGRNKLEITLVESARVSKGATTLTFYFRQFTKEEIVDGTVRIGIGKVAYAFLTDLRNPLRPMAGEAFSYYLECPPDVVQQEQLKEFTVYLPRPLGEGVGDISRKITIMVKARE